MTCQALRVYSVSFLFMGVAAFGSSFFTALNNGVVSAAISFLRVFVFEIGAILLLPALLGKEAIWWAVVVSELGALILTTVCFVVNRKKYHY